MRFFLDSNMPYSILDLFKELNLEAIRSRDLGLARADDEEIVKYAIKNKYVLITKDLEFANRKRFPINSTQGIIILRLPFFFKANQVKKVLKDTLISMNIKELERSITIIKLGRYRIRKITKS